MEGFREYLEELPDELLEQVSEDYVWLSRLRFRGKSGLEFERRREWCRAECARRGMMAGAIVSAEAPARQKRPGERPRGLLRAIWAVSAALR